MRQPCPPARRAHHFSRRRLIGGLGACIGLAPGLVGCVTSPPVTALPDSVPVEVTPSGDFIVRMRLGEAEDVPFKLDTGAAMSALYADFAHLGTAPETPAVVEIWGLGGTSVRPVVQLAGGRLGGVAYSGLDVAILKNSRPETDAVGLIGMDVLSGWTMEAHAGSGQRAIYPAGQVPARRFHGWDRVPLVEDPFGAHAYGFKFGQVEVWDSQVPALIDTGSHLSIMNWEAARLVPNLRRYWQRAYEAWRYYGAVGEFRVTSTSELQDIRMGEAVWDRVEVIITDLDSLSLLGSAGHPLIIAGANMFAHRDFIFDPSRSELHVRGAREDLPKVVFK